ncbi:MAG TPA: DUF3105 domain-containing protein, partial [Gammaproteobacteria bacterium]|nr:DUF3105 domain-containing protein [Gammaproteobacteria bacterium]
LLLTSSMLATVYVLYNMGRKPIIALWSWSKPTPARRITGALATVGAVSFIALLWLPQVSFVGRRIPASTQHFEVTERDHIQEPIAYLQSPPVGGNHAPIWQNCGFYGTPIANENAVHSLEHGAVWVTYRPDLPRDQVHSLRRLARRQSYMLVSPFPSLAAPVIASAWGYQLHLDSVGDPRLDQFIRAFRLGPQAPERGGPCTGGIGAPSQD